MFQLALLLHVMEKSIITDIRVADSGGLNFDQDLVWTRLRDLEVIVDLQDRSAWNVNGCLHPYKVVRLEKK